MSDSASDFPESQVYIHNFLHLLGITILYYDHLLTFGEEYWRIWRAPYSGASILFLINRYFAFFVNITVTAGNFGNFRTTQSCSRYSVYRQVILIATQVLVGITQFLRTYALYSRTKRVATLILGVACVLVTLSVWAIVGQTSQVSLFHGCHIASSKISAIHIAIAWESLFVFDAMIFSLTLFKTYHERLTYNLSGEMDLVSLIFRDGAIYFGVMVCAQGANVITFYICAPALRGVLSTSASAISVTMMSRLMLNLHQTAASHSDLCTSSVVQCSSCPSTLQFSTRIGAGASMSGAEAGLSSRNGHHSMPENATQAVPQEHHITQIHDLSSVSEAMEMTNFITTHSRCAIGDLSPAV